MPDVNAIEAALRQELITAGLVRRPSEPGILPPMVVEPVDGPPASGELEGSEAAVVVVSLMLSGDVAPPAFGPTRISVFDVRYRARDSSALRQVYALDRAIRARLVDGRVDYGLGWTMGAAAPSAGDADGTPGVFVLQSSVFGGLSRLSSSKSAGYDHVAKYAIEVQA